VAPYGLRLHRVRAGYDSDRDECPDCGCPDADVTDEGIVGRFWGYRGLHRELAIRQVTPAVGIAAGRIARRWYRAKGLTNSITVQRVEQVTGRVRYRRSTVRKELFKHGLGFVCVNDAARSSHPRLAGISPRWAHKPSCILVNIPASKSVSPVADTSTCLILASSSSSDE
jgi:hypothetical protein